MSKGIVECVHWDPEVDPALQETQKKNKWILLAGVAAVVAVAVGVSLWLFLPRDKPPVDPPTGGEQPTVSQSDTVPGETQPQPQSPTEEDPILTQGIAFYSSGSYAEAMAALDQALTNNPESGAAYTYRGLTQFQLANYPAAIQDLTQALRRMGESADLVTLRGTAYYMQGFYPEAIGDLTRAIALNPGSTKAYSYRAMAYDATNQPDLAAADRARIGV